MNGPGESDRDLVARKIADILLFAEECLQEARKQGDLSQEQLAAIIRSVTEKNHGAAQAQVGGRSLSGEGGTRPVEASP